MRERKILFFLTTYEFIFPDALQYGDKFHRLQMGNDMRIEQLS